jgi:hypothetical protein
MPILIVVAVTPCPGTPADVDELGPDDGALLPAEDFVEQPVTTKAPMASTATAAGAIGPDEAVLRIALSMPVGR